MATSYRRETRRHRAKAADHPLPLLGDYDRIEMAPGHVSEHTARYTTLESVVALLACEWLAERLPTTGHLLDPCAGDGRMVTFLDSLAPVPPSERRWTLAELRPEPVLKALARRRPQSLTVHNPCDMRFNLPPQPDCDAVFTNWPWYGWSSIFERTRELAPDAVIAGISCDQERRDGGRHAWFREHAPSVIAHLPDRQRFEEPGKPIAGKYPYTVSWYIWWAGITCAPETRVVWL